MIEIYKKKHSLNPSFVRDIFIGRNNQYSLRSGNHLQLQTAKTISYGIKNIQYRGYFLWSTESKGIKRNQKESKGIKRNQKESKGIKDSKTVSEFKRKTKLWSENSRICRLCKIFVTDLGFL